MMMVGILFLVLTLLMTGEGLFLTGVRMEPQECLRILGFIFISVIYVDFWLFFTVFYQIIVNLVIRSVLPDPRPDDDGANGWSYTCSFTFQRESDDRMASGKWVYRG